MEQVELSFFFPENVEKREQYFYITPTERIKGADGKPVVWKFEYPNQENFEDIQKASVKRDKDGKLMLEADFTGMDFAAIEHCCIYPDLKNGELQDAYNVGGAEDSERALIEKLLYPDEIYNLGQAILKKIGLAKDYQELIKDAKN